MGKNSTIIIWNEKLYGIGIAELDQQHRKLIDLINELNTAISRGEQKGVVGSVLAGLADYVKYHFSEEEALMEKLNYSGIDSHKKQHAHFVNRITNILKRMKKGDAVSAYELCSFLKDWLINHICISDRKVADCLATLVKSST